MVDCSNVKPSQVVIGGDGSDEIIDDLVKTFINPNDEFFLLSGQCLRLWVLQVRDCTSFKGLDEYWIRISICTPEENKKFINILKEVLN